MITPLGSAMVGFLFQGTTAAKPLATIVPQVHLLQNTYKITFIAELSGLKTFTVFKKEQCHAINQ
jgi:hypothetical protein